MVEELKRCKRFSEAASLMFGVKYYNGYIKKKLEKKCFEEYNIDINKIIKKNNKKYCLFCGKEIAKNKKFCNNSCAASFNNRNRVITDEQKRKTSVSLIHHYDNIHGVNRNRSRKKHQHVCPVCNTYFYGKIKQVYCSRKCAQNSQEIKNKLSNNAKKRIENGTFSGWKVRNKKIQSYPEKFWEKVLQNNNIQYESEKHVGKYFLDFVIPIGGILVDLEIDGKQHKEKNIKQKDLERDEYLRSEGYVIYRVEWNSINNLSGKQKMQDKINNFIDFINTII